MVVHIFQKPNKNKKNQQKQIKKKSMKKKKKKVVRYSPQLMALQTIRVETVFAINMVPPDARFFYPV